MDKILIILISLCLFLSGCSSEKVIINDISIEVEIAKTQEELKEGLMFRDHLKKEEGMLLVFEKESRRSIWMKNVMIPLDIIFINSDKEIIDIITMQPCRSDQCDQYSAKAMYILEVNEGFAKENDIKKGDKVILRYRNKDQKTINK